MKMQIRAVVVVALLLLIAGSALAQGSVPLRIGVYDSRAVALAYFNSPLQKSPTPQAALKSEYAQAKAENDAEKVKELEAAGIALQQLMHEQAFSTGSISNIVALIKDKLPEIARKNGVPLLISKWDVAYRDPAVEYVDLTLPVVELFSPGEKVLGWLKELKNQDPVPIDNLPRNIMK